MSGSVDPSEDGDREAAHLVLQCECCLACFAPADLGSAAIDDVPHDARCPRCGCFFVEAEWDPGEGKPPVG